MGQQPLLGQILLIIKASRLHSATLHSVGLPWASDQPDAIDLYLAKHDTYKRQTFIFSAEFEPTILVSEGPHTHTLDRAATGIVTVTDRSPLNFTDADQDGTYLEGYNFPPLCGLHDVHKETLPSQLTGTCHCSVVICYGNINSPTSMVFVRGHHSNH
jgi:hypothetical protein